MLTHSLNNRVGVVGNQFRSQPQTSKPERAPATMASLPWFRIAMTIVMLSSDDVEGALTNIAYVVLGWSLKEVFGIVQQLVLLPKLVALGKVHPEAWRRAKIPYGALFFLVGLSAGVQWALYETGRGRLGYFLILTTGALPTFKCAVYPRVWPIGPFLAAMIYGVWRFEGVKELFVGLVLFQGVATAQELWTYYLGPSAFWSFVIWAVTFACIAPIPVIFAAAYFYPKLVDRVIRRRKKPEYVDMWAKFEWYAKLLGFSDAEGVDPFRTLGLSRTATSAQIRKRYRDLSMVYHPDKTGNDPAKTAMFIKIQKAMDMVTKGTFDDARPADERAVHERVFSTISRCGALTPVIAIWLGLSILSGLGYLIRRGASSDAEDAAEDAYSDPRVGASFVGSNIFGYGSGRRARRGTARVENTNAGGARVVAGRRIATPAGPGPRFHEIEAEDASDERDVPPLIPTDTGKPKLA